MKTLNLKVIAVLLLTTVLAACGSSHSDDPAGSTGSAASVATSLRYFKGGGFVPPGQPTWIYDLTIDFTQSAFKVTAKINNSSCVKQANMTTAQSNELNELISDLSLARNPGPAVPDASEEYMEFTTTTNSTVKIYLEDIGSPVNAVYATAGGPELADYFQDLIATLPTVCP